MARLHANLRVCSLVTLVVMVLARGIFQYRWIGQVSDAQESRALAHLREKVGLITDAIDTEITRAALVFTMPPPPSSPIFD